ncbi:cyclin-D3-1-like [Mercurialis annua]|uniref:cyclin-D3-1-like n=1 Tax=Mercurialis annua TaxID=3986 RepID=UPI002160BFA7|nr:cyclin-D3-1-like [Mercurialis annua]
MAPSFDCAVASLLCAEDNISIFSENDKGNDCCYGVLGEFEDATWNQLSNQDRGFDDGFLMGIPTQSEECLNLMVEKECEHLPNLDYLKKLRSGDLDLEARSQAVDWIGKVHAQFGFGPLCAYLSLNYLDRFLAAYELPMGKAWMMQLLAVACLSIAAKMEETYVPFSLDLQAAESKFIFEARTIQRMELLVLSTLSWRMQAITPFSFIDYFLKKIYNDETPTKSLILQSIELILSTSKGIDLLDFRPSEIAAAVAIAVVGEIKTVDAEQAISILAQHVQKEKVMKCIEVIQDLALIGEHNKGVNETILSFPQSPIGVLDAACLSYRSDESTGGSCVNSSQNIPDAKRRKLNRPWEV